MWKKAEIIKKIFSFHNTTHTNNSFIICGIEDTSNEIVGTNKLNSTELDVINRHLNELANNIFLNHRLNVEVRQFEYKEKNEINFLCERYKKYSEYKDLGWNETIYYSESIRKIINLIIYFYKDDILKWENIDTIIFKFKEKWECLFE